jgi:hypothetical protein
MEVYRGFREAYCFHLQGRGLSQLRNQEAAKDLWNIFFRNIYEILPDYMVWNTIRQHCSYFHFVKLKSSKLKIVLFISLTRIYFVEFLFLFLENKTVSFESHTRPYISAVCHKRMLEIYFHVFCGNSCFSFCSQNNLFSRKHFRIFE